MFSRFLFADSKVGPEGPRRYLKSSLEAVRSFGTPREPMASHGDLFMTIFIDFGHVFITWYASFLALLSSSLSGLTSVDSWTPARSCHPHTQKSCYC